MKIKNSLDAASWRLCVGCGACSYICPENKISLIDVVDDGIRPFLDPEGCGDCIECIRTCPGIETAHEVVSNESDIIQQLHGGFGPIREVWEGYAADRGIRYHGSSGGLASALALYCLEQEDMHCIVHTGTDDEQPWKNKTVVSKNRDDILSRTGSRYSPASPCDGLDYMESARSACVFIGKPCDISALRKAQSIKPELNNKIGVAIGIFCAGTPSTQGTLDLLKRAHIKPEDLEEIRYRGKGWPGMTAIKTKGSDNSLVLSYKESWGFLNNYRPYRCYLCPDGTSEFADISCGDPWYREIQNHEIGHSLVLVRTEKGERIVHGAMREGYAILNKIDPEALIDSQKNLLLKRGAIWGRLLTMKAFGIPTPRFQGFSLFHNWVNLPVKEKLRSIFGTARRIFQRQYYRPGKNK
ncbi:MAG TPA: 4Fe-4S dicluster domain-containing protein [Bacteroidaceae bacterium]|nr:4Fe-4S dicluster domain-containing protein [Bacteroidaceae bacterium]